MHLRARWITAGPSPILHGRRRNEAKVADSSRST
jgi:hypothetical protein